MSQNLFKTIFAVTAVFFAVHANAQSEAEPSSSEQSVSSTFPKPTPIEDKSEFRPHLGVTAGIANPEGSYDTAPEFGIDVGFQPCGVHALSSGLADDLWLPRFILISSNRSKVSNIAARSNFRLSLAPFVPSVAVLTAEHTVS